jgi:hypothetical protein
MTLRGEEAAPTLRLPPAMRQVSLLSSFLLLSLLGCSAAPAELDRRLAAFLKRLGR